MACSTPIHNASPYAEKKTRMCRFFLGPRGCRDGEDCLYRHIDDRPTCKYYFSKWGCWNGKWCKYRHSEPESEEAETAKQFYKELNEWLGPAKTADDSILSTDSPSPVECTTPKPAVVTTAPPKKFVSRGTQTKTTPDFVHCGECGEEFKSSRTLQQSLERHYIHKLASADFHHLRFFKRHPQLQGGDPFCSACGELFNSITELLQHMGRSVSFTTGTASVSVRHEHQSWFKQLVQPFVYRDLEVLETEDDMVQCILDIYFYKKPTTPVAPASTVNTANKQSPAHVSPMKLARKLQREVNGSLDNVSPYIHCEECGEIFDDPDNDEKLRDHYADMLTRADGLHVKQLRKWLNTEAQCSVCNKTFLSVVALLQHVGSKERVTASNNRVSASNHSHLLNDIADVFVGRTLGVEGYITQEDMIGKIQELTWSGEPCHPNEVPSSSDEAFVESPIANADDVKEEAKEEGVSKEPNKKEGVDEALQMARYFCRVNEWQAKMSYPEYVKDDQERTRNYGFTVAEVGYLATKGLTPTSRGVFNVLNSLYRRRRNPLKSVSSMTGGDPPKANEVKPAKSPKKDVSFSEKPEEPKKSGQSKPEAEDIVETVETVEESEEGSPIKGQKPKPKRKKRVRRRRRSKGGVTDQDELDETAEKKSSSKNKSSVSGSAAAANKEKEANKSKNVKSKRERLLSRDIEGEELNVLMQVHMDGTIFIREKLAQAQEEVIPKNTKDDSTLQMAVDQSLHDAPSASSITSRVFVVHKDGTIDIVLQVAGIPIDTTPIDTSDNYDASSAAQGTESAVKPKAQIRDNDVGKASPQRDFREEDSAIIAAKVSPRSAAVVAYTGDQRSDVKTQIMNYLLTATTEQETSGNKGAKDVPAEQTAPTPVAQQSSDSGEVVKSVTEESKVKEETKKEEISEAKPKDQDIKLEKETNQQDIVAEQSTQPEKPAEAKTAESETTSEAKTEEGKTQIKPCEAKPEDETKNDQKEDKDSEFCMVAVEDVSESSSQKAVPVTGCETNEEHAPKDINGNADPAPPSDKMEKEKTVTEVNNNTENVAGVTTAPSECRI